MDCVNLLAFIQIAVAFDFGLVYLSNSHIFTSILNSLLEELSEHYGEFLKRAKTVCEDTSHHKVLAVRVKRAELLEVINNVEFMLDPGNIRWDKYAYTGIYSGVYGLLCLLLIGVENCRIEDYIHNFLLISGEIILVYQVINLLQLYRISNNKISIVKVISKLLWLCCILIVSAVMAWVGCYWKFFPSFSVPFVLMTSVIVYFPFLVYGFRIVQVCHKVKSRIKNCKMGLNEMEGLLD